jgi:queuine tRNA-ribosyltransferase
MPVGTVGTVKGVSPHELQGLGAGMILANTYHLYLRPGHERVASLGGLHDFMRWDGPILTDSGGFQVFSLADINEIRDDGVVFQSHIDGSRHLFTPERVMEIQRTLGADVIMAFDECPPGGSTREAAREANARTLRWLERCRTRFHELEDEAPVPPQALFPVTQGNVYEDLRREHVQQFRELGPWPGWGIGGLSVGEAKPDMWRVLEALHGELPTDRPRYLMGVGYPDDLLEAISRGCDMFDCVAPTRNARHGTAWTLAHGQINLKAARFKDDTRPIDPAGCDCYACTHFDRAYLRHLMVCGERFGHRLVSLHNLRFLVALGEEARRRIRAGEFASWAAGWLERYRG